MPYLKNSGGSGSSGGSKREVAWRLFAFEYNSSKFVYPPKEERAPRVASYVLTPAGALVNRLFIVGTYLSSQPLGSNGINGSEMIRATVSDPSGSNFYIYAGRFQPQVLHKLKHITPPTYLAVVGKSHIFTPQGTDRVFVSIRPESVQEVECEIKDYWTLAACKSLKQRLDAIETAQGLTRPDAELLEKLGYPKLIATGVCLALQYYERLNLEFYQSQLIKLLYQILEAPEGITSETALEKELVDMESTLSGTEFRTYGTAIQAEEFETLRNELLELLTRLDPDNRGVDYFTVEQAAVNVGIESATLSELLDLLKHEGAIIEYETNKFKIKR